MICYISFSGKLCKLHFFCWQSLNIIVFSTDFRNKLPYCIFICSFFPICYTTASGIRNVDRRYVQAARSLGSSDLRILATVVFPLALPDIFTGLRLEAGMAWRVIIAAEMVAIPTGIGALLMRSESLLRVDTIIACLMVLSVMCFCFERLFLVMETRITEQWR